MALCFWREGSEGTIAPPPMRGGVISGKSDGRVSTGGGSISASAPHPQSGANRGMVHISGAHVRSFIVLIKGNI